MAGRKSKPYQLKMLSGTLRKDRENKRMIKEDPLSSLPDPPGHFRDIHKKIYYEMGNMAIIQGTLTPLSLHMFILFCHFLGSHYECEMEMEGIKKHILVKYNKQSDKTITGMEMHGLSKYSIECVKQARLLAAEFGFSPASIQKISPINPMKKSKFREYLDDKQT